MNIIETLTKGEVDFLFNLTPYDEKSVIQYIRTNPKRLLILEKCLPQIKDRLPEFSFKISYDTDQFKDVAFEIMKKYPYLTEMTPENISNVLNNTHYGEEYVFNDFYSLIKKDENKIMKVILEFIFEKPSLKMKTWIEFLSKNSNFHIRAIFF